MNGAGDGWYYRIKGSIKQIQTQYSWNFGPLQNQVEEEVEDI